MTSDFARHVHIRAFLGARLPRRPAKTLPQLFLNTFAHAFDCTTEKLSRAAKAIEESRLTCADLSFDNGRIGARREYQCSAFGARARASGDGFLVVAFHGKAHEDRRVTPGNLKCFDLTHTNARKRNGGALGKLSSFANSRAHLSFTRRGERQQSGDEGKGTCGG